MASRVLSLRIDAALWDRINAHAARRGMSAQDYVVRTLMRDDFDERFKTAVEATDRFYAEAPRPGQEPPAGSGPAARDPAARRAHPPAKPPAHPQPHPQGRPQTRPSAGIR
ncbi:hypothetical protein RVR_3938 [Actinacidiphila reveromycinica]|uniref:Ribbon-helix-helix protein CopG domain-containing protein n=1 Tax=Actinacidiphila reveromycinica TaxID=659352 RepID=A0A7U3USI0_9ACTN|nr:hypothetical protein [Streptomyces sp. SN-593]BBA97949.1 hypothetical protein RVR_3938 [Streptomyces sp. SN-593]